MKNWKIAQVWIEHYISFLFYCCFNVKTENNKFIGVRYIVEKSTAKKCEILEYNYFLSFARISTYRMHFISSINPIRIMSYDYYYYYGNQSHTHTYAGSIGGSQRILHIERGHSTSCTICDLWKLANKLFCCALVFFIEIEHRKTIYMQQPQKWKTIIIFQL